MGNILDSKYKETHIRGYIDVGDGYWRRNVCSRVGCQHLQEFTRTLILSPSSKNCYQHRVTNITMSPTWVLPTESRTSIRAHFQTLNLVVLPHVCEKFEPISEWFIKQKRTKVDFISNAMDIEKLASFRCTRGEIKQANWILRLYHCWCPWCLCCWFLDFGNSFWSEFKSLGASREIDEN